MDPRAIRIDRLAARIAELENDLETAKIVCACQEQAIDEARELIEMLQSRIQQLENSEAAAIKETP